MPTEVIMPKVDMDMASATIAGWHVDEGAQVRKGEALFDIETDKAAMEVESPASGAIHFLKARSGERVDIGVCIAWIFADGEAVSEPGAAAPGPLPSARASGPDVAMSGAEDAPSLKDTQMRGADARTSRHRANSSLPGGRIRATPLARRMARMAGIDLAQIAGSGPRGRITRRDVDSARAKAAAGKAVTLLAASTQGPGLMADRARLDALGVAWSAVPVSRMRARIAERLSASKAHIPHFYLEAECRLDRLLAWRAQANDALSMSGPVSGHKKISLNDLLVKASALALAAVPAANASWAGTEILRYHDANVSVAVAIEDGLITPVVRAAQKKSLRTISAEIAGLAERARKGGLASHEYQGGSFTLSNLGMHGVTAFSAIINPPESMILAVGKASRRFVEADDGSPVAATILPVRLSCDHRVVDGALGTRWLGEWQRLVENPILLSLDM